MLANLIETQSAGLALRIAARRAQRTQIVITVDDDGLVKRCSAAWVSGADEGMERERRRTISARELFNERANLRWFGRNRHGFFGGKGTTDGVAGFAGALFGGVVELVRRDVLSAFGSM